MFENVRKQIMKKILWRSIKLVIYFLDRIIDEEARRVNEFNSLHLGENRKGGEG